MYRFIPQVYKCLSCDFLFGNMSDLKRHLKLRHSLRMVDVDITIDAAKDETSIHDYDCRTAEERRGTENNQFAYRNYVWRYYVRKILLCTFSCLRL